MLTAPSLYAGRLEVVISRRLGGTTKLVLAILSTGLLAGVGSVGFHYLADGNFLFAWCESHAALSRLPVVLAVSTIGLGLIGLVLQFIPESRFGGVKEVFEALERSRAVIPLRRMLNVVLSGLVLAFGGSVGPEGPMIQMGGTHRQSNRTASWNRPTSRRTDGASRRCSRYCSRISFSRRGCAAGAGAVRRPVQPRIGGRWSCRRRWLRG
jgi:H+/Cl- antiporter ClcA